MTAVPDRVWVIFDWDAGGWQGFASDPEVPEIMQDAGHKTGLRYWSSPARTTRNTEGDRSTLEPPLVAGFGR